MHTSKTAIPTSTRVVILTADAEFERAARATFGASKAIDLSVVTGNVTEAGDKLNADNATIVVVDCDAARPEELAALGRLTARLGARPPVLAVTQVFDESVARLLMQMRGAE
jgi:pilus assembly protein CpaE